MRSKRKQVWPLQEPLTPAELRVREGTRSCRAGGGQGRRQKPQRGAWVRVPFLLGHRGRWCEWIAWEKVESVALRGAGVVALKRSWQNTPSECLPTASLGETWVPSGTCCNKHCRLKPLNKKTSFRPGDLSHFNPRCSRGSGSITQAPSCVLPLSPCFSSSWAVGQGQDPKLGPALLCSHSGENAFIQVSPAQSPIPSSPGKKPLLPKVSEPLFSNRLEPGGLG